MRQRRGHFWISAGIAGSVLLCSIPANWNNVTVVAAPKQAYVTTAQGIQQEFVTGMKARQTSISFKYKGSTKSIGSVLQTAMSAALESDPYTKYVVERYNYAWEGTKNGIVSISLKVNYRENAAQSNYVNKRAAEILKEILVAEMNEHEKVKAIHDYVVQNMKYDTQMKKYTAYDAVYSGEAVCQGYALLTYRMLELAGMKNYIVEGIAGKDRHAWNLVQINGAWYHLDTTWNDPIGSLPDDISYKYYLLNDQQMKKDHSWSVSVPAASTLYRDTLKVLESRGDGRAAFYRQLQTELGYDLYKQENVISSKSQLKSAVAARLKDGGKDITIRYAGTEKQLSKDLPELYELPIQQITYMSEPFESTGDLKVWITWEL